MNVGNSLHPYYLMNDPKCRFAKLEQEQPSLPGLEHRCTHHNGAPLQPGETCWMELRAQQDDEMEAEMRTWVIW